jgi:TRAP-type uncharacterized transport system fused permease subunit
MSEAKPGFSVQSPRRILIFLIALAMALFHLYGSGVRPLPGIQQRSIHLAFALALTFLLFPFKSKSSGASSKGHENRPLSLIDLLLVILSFAIGIYGFIEYESFSFRVGNPTFFDSISAVMAIFLVMEATRRILGIGVIIICLMGFAYLGYGEHLPSYIAHTGFTFERIVNYMFLTTEGILGPALAVSATVIVTFIIFGAVLQVSGAGPLFIDTGMALFGKYRGGPAKAAVLGSCFFGMITGSQVANVGAVGVFTIPLMKGGGIQAGSGGGHRSGRLDRVHDHAPGHGRSGIHYSGNHWWELFRCCEGSHYPRSSFLHSALYGCRIAGSEVGPSRSSDVCASGSEGPFQREGAYAYSYWGSYLFPRY